MSTGDRASIKRSPTRYCSVLPTKLAAVGQLCNLKRTREYSSIEFNAKRELSEVFLLTGE